MKSLNIQGTNDVPQVHFDYKKGNLFMGGSSLPENILEVFNPIMSWVEEYKAQRSSFTHVEFNFEYLNTSSTNMVARLIESLSAIRQIGELKITWYYTHGDYDMRELGEDLLEENDLSYEIIEVAV